LRKFSISAEDQPSFFCLSLGILNFLADLLSGSASGSSSSSESELEDSADEAEPDSLLEARVRILFLTGVSFFPANEKNFQ
jgi:hypothetical protein